ncbi:unnamed protein product, partial [Polarella glacialis]
QPKKYAFPKTLTIMSSMGLFTGPATEHLQVAALGDPSWLACARFGSRSLLHLADPDVRPLVPAQRTVVGWASHSLLPRGWPRNRNAAKATRPPALRRSRGRPAALADHTQPAVIPEEKPTLKPIFFEHDRSGHAERQLLCAILE